MTAPSINPVIEISWLKALNNEFDQPYFQSIKNTLVKEKKSYKIFPPGNQIFNAYNHTPLQNVKVVIIGQDPYHGYGQANGLCFSVKNEIPHPPSLINIFKELQDDLELEYPKNGDLTKWADQGVLLLNATLTVRESQANSHQNIGWQKFTDATIKKISDEKQGVVFLLWGGFAKKKASLIDQSKHHVLTSGHPSPLSANKGYWFGNKHFSQTNMLLKKQGLTPIDWQIE